MSAVPPKCPACGSHETLSSIIGMGEEIEVLSERASGRLTKADASDRLSRIHEEKLELVARRLRNGGKSLLMLKQIMAGGLLKDQDVCACCGVVFYPNIGELREQAERFRDEMRRKHPLDSIIVETSREGE